MEKRRGGKIEGETLGEVEGERMWEGGGKRLRGKRD